jgi:VWFA-related protein
MGRQVRGFIIGPGPNGLIALIMSLSLRIVSAAAVAAVWLVAADVRRTIEISFVATPPGGAAGGTISAADLKLTDNGKDQPIASLWKVTPGKIPSNLPPHTFSNRTGGETAQDVSVIFLDGVNTEWRNDTAGREETMRALQQIKAEERVAILVFGKTLRVFSDFSDSAAARQAKVKEFGAAKEAAGPTYSDLVLPVSSTGRAEMYREQERLTSTYATLQSIAAMLKAAPGRKNLLWISGDFPLLLGRPEAGGRHPSDADADFQRTAKIGYNKAADDLIRVLNMAGVAVYPVDARKVSLDPQRRQSHVNSITTTGAGEAGTINDIMKHLAEQTGGAVFSGGKELGDDLRGALDDAQNAYVLAFTPAKLAEDGASHKLKLQAKGYQIRLRPVYYAPLPPAPPGDATARLASALSAPLDVPEIGITVRVEPDRASEESLTISLELDARDIQLVRQGEDWIGMIGVGIVQGNPAGEQFGRQLQSGGFTIHGPDYQKAMQTGNGIHFDFKVKRDPKATFIKFGIIDQKSLKSGSLSVPL